MSAHRTMHHLDSIGFNVAGGLAAMAVDLIAARRDDIVFRRMAARRARIDAKLALIGQLRARRMAG